MPANVLTIAKRVAKLTQTERQLVLALADSLSGQRRYTRKKRVVVAKAAKRAYTKKSVFWSKKKAK